MGRLKLMGKGHHTSGGGGWTPASEGASLIAWWNGSHGVTTSGSNFVSWADQSGNSNTLTPVGSGANIKPSGSFGTWTGGPGVEVYVPNGVDLLTANIPINTATFSFWATIVPDNADSQGGGRLLSILASGQTHDYDNTGSLQFTRQNSTTVSAGSNFAALGGTITTTDFSPCTIGLVLDGTNAKTYFNNTLAGSTSWSNTLGGSGSTLFRLFGDYAGSEVWAGVYLDAAIFSDVVTAANYQTYSHGLGYV